MKFQLLFMLVLLSCNSPNNESANMVSGSLQNEKLVLEYFKYFNHHNWEKLSQMYEANAQFLDPAFGGEPIRQSHEGIVQKYSDLEAYIPDVQDEVLNIYPSGENVVIVEFVSKGTAPDSTAFRLPMCVVFTFKNGKITKDNTYYDNF